MKTEVVTKINNMGKVGQIIARIGEVILIIAFVVCLLGAVGFAFIPKDVFTVEMAQQTVIHMDMSKVPFADFVLSEAMLDENFSEVTEELVRYATDGDIWGYALSGSELKLTEDVKTFRLDLSHVKWLMVPVMLLIAAVYVVLHFAARLCKVFRYCQTPFADEIITAFKRLVISIIPMAILSAITQSIAAFVVTGERNVILNFDLITLLLVLLVFLLAAVFKYGAMLQTESDETL